MSGFSALAFVSMMGFGVAFSGDRHGVGFLYMGASLPFLLYALMTGYAFGKLRRASRPTTGKSDFPLLLVTASVLAAIAVWIAGSAQRGESPSTMAPETREPSPARIPPSQGFGPLRMGGGVAPWKPGSAGIQEPGGEAELSGYQRAFLEAVIRRASMLEKKVPDPEQDFKGRRYLSGHHLTDSVDTYGGPTDPSSLSCRATLIKVLLPQALTAWPKESLFHFSGSIGDSLFQFFGCREFSPRGHYYELSEFSGRPESTPIDSAFWRPIEPQYRISIVVNRSWEDSARWARGTLSPDSLLEDAWVTFEIEPDNRWSDESSPGLILQSESEVDTLPFAYARQALKRNSKPEWDAQQRTFTLRSETEAIESGDFHSLAWMQKLHLPSPADPDSQTTMIDEAELRGITRDGEPILLASGNTNICNGNEMFQESGNTPPVLVPELEEGSPLILSDLDGDGKPEILLDSRVLGKRWIFTRKYGIQFEVILLPAAWRPPCC